MARRRRKQAGGGLWVFTVLLVGVALGLTGVASQAVKPDPRRRVARSPRASPKASASSPRESSPQASASASPPPSGEVLVVHFYDVSHGLAALVEVTGGAHVLVDTGDSPSRKDCGDDCARAHEHLMSGLRRDLGGAPIDVLWITHQHADHIGGARDILRELPVKLYVDNGRDLQKGDVRHAHDAARLGGVSIETIDPSQTHLDASIPGSMRLTPVLPDAWPADCAHDPNDCSIGLRVDFGGSSILFTGDAEREEENALVRGTKVTLLQVGHHGSETSTSEAFLSRVEPSYAVISAGHRGAGMNSEYCLPRMSTVTRLNHVLPGEMSQTLSVYDARVSCKRATDDDWVSMPVSDHLWATERDGDVVLVTRGDGVFTRQDSAPF